MTRITNAVCLFLPFVLFGCGGSSKPVANLTGPNLPIVSQKLSGKAMDGQQPIAGAHVYLLAANTGGYGSASASLLEASDTGYSDSVGAYVMTALDGSFSISQDYSCTAGSQLYLYVLGGNAGPGVNTAIGELAIVGGCPASSVASLTVNEATTIAAAYAFAGFAVDATHVSSSGTAQAKAGVTNAFANAANLASLSTGEALSVTPASNGTVPQATINTLANLLSACIRSSSSASSECETLLASAGSPSVSPTDTATAAIDIAHSPASNVDDLYSLQTSASPFSPALAATPNDFSIGINITGGGIDYPKSLAVDAGGNVWITSEYSTAVTELSSSGAFLSGASGYPAGLVYPFGMAIDLEGNAWVTNYSSEWGAVGNVVELSNSGSVISVPDYTGGGMQMPAGISIDGLGNAWMTNFTNVITELNSSGVPLLDPSGYTPSGLDSEPSIVAVDGSGNVWIANSGGIGVVKLSNSGAVLSGINGFTGAGAGGLSIAIDGLGNAWVAEGYSVAKFSNAGVLLSGSHGYSGGGLDDAYSVAIDGSGNAWVTNVFGNSVSEFSSSGLPLSGTGGYTSGDMSYPGAIAIDPSGNAWIANYYTTDITEMIGIATPVITPICAGLPATPTADGSSKLGTRP